MSEVTPEVLTESTDPALQELQDKIKKSLEQRTASLGKARAMLESEPHPAAYFLADAIEEIINLQDFIMTEFANVENAIQYLSEESTKQELLLTGTLNHLEESRVVTKVAIHKSVGNLIRERQAVPDAPPADVDLRSVS